MEDEDIELVGMYLDVEDMEALDMYDELGLDIAWDQAVS